MGNKNKAFENLKPINIIWSDRKRHFGAPISFTVFSLSEDRLFVKAGLLSTTSTETLLYRIKDITEKQTFWQKLCGVGSVVIETTDSGSPVIIIKNVKHSQKVKELIHQKTEAAKSKIGIALVETK